MTMKLMGPMCSAIGDHDACTQQATCQCSCHKTSDPYGLEPIRADIEAAKETKTLIPDTLHVPTWDARGALIRLEERGFASPERADIYVRLVEGLSLLVSGDDEDCSVCGGTEDGCFSDCTSGPGRAVLKDIERNAHD